MTTDLQSLLDQIDRLDQQATKGPWEAEHTTDESYQPPSVLHPLESGETRELIAWVDPSNEDADFIALARTALPQLAEAVYQVLELLRVEENKPSNKLSIMYDGTPFPATVPTSEVRQAITDAMKADHAG